MNKSILFYHRAICTIKTYNRGAFLSIRANRNQILLFRTKSLGLSQC
ncbi:putative conjugative transfer protein TraD [Rickettsia amblyommatis str. Darkwater]|nr:putative conjugative transfer protein TraD [Rickettsia amblyommatis str. Darkwater]